MNNEKPQTIEEYRKWLKKQHEVEISHGTKTYYESVASKIKCDIEKSDFWEQLTRNLEEYSDEYRVETGYPLLILPFVPDLHIKPFDSFLLKTFRKNVSENKHWPDKPEGGWILPNNWYAKINDIIRTLFVVKYIDGVKFMTDKTGSLCEQYAMECTVQLEATEEGYYAAHLYMMEEFEIPKFLYDTERVVGSVEIQITTQLQEVIRKLLHKYYESRRRKTREEELKWQWDYRSDEFVANYLGHILHYVEGMIMEVRERQKKEEMI